MKTLVLGASANESRYSNKAIGLLRHYGHEVIGVGKHTGPVGDVMITKDFPEGQVDTITMYLSPAHQAEYYDKIIQAKPRRIIFNPGAENDELKKLVEAKGIVTEDACTLVLLNTGQY